MKGEVCLTCKLHENCTSPFMDSSGSEKPEVLVIGEAPGEYEDRSNTPFVGPAGELLRTALENTGFDPEVTRFTNTVRCRPPGNKITREAIQHCKQFALEDIEKYNPKVVIIAGNSALQGILGENGIKDWAGSIIDRDERIYAPIYHPAYILRNKLVMDEWLDSLLKINDAMNGIFEEDSKIEIVLPSTVKEVMEMRDYLSEFEYIAYDVETSTLDAYSKTDVLLAVSFAAGTKAFSIPVRHKESWWKNSDLLLVEETIRDILNSHNNKLMGHNIKFDLEHTFTQFGNLYRASDDTMLISSLIDSAPGKHGLKRLSATYLGWYDHENEMDEYAREHPEADAKKAGSYSEMPLKILLPYSAKDSGAVLLLRPILYEKLTEKQKILYDELVMSISNLLTEIELNGMEIDRHIAERYRNIYEMRAQEVYEEIVKDKLVKRIIKDKQALKGKKSWKFNPRSSAHMVEFVYKYGKMPITAKTDKGVPSVKADVLTLYEERMPILKRIKYYKVLRDALSKYLTPALTSKWLSDDGRVHTNFKANGAETGRISSEHPNIQNIPTAEKLPGTLLEYLPIKNLFTTRFGNNGALVSLDESAMELRVFASASDCTPMLEAFTSGKDIHTAVAAKATGIPYEKIDKDTRYYYKRVNWTILYAGSASTLHKRYRIPMRTAEKLFEDYFQEFPQVEEHIANTIKFARKNGYVESAFGRRRYFTYIKSADETPTRAADERASVNMPIQSAASDILLASAVIISFELEKRGLSKKAVFVNTVHDSIVIDCEKSVVVEVTELCKEVMENIHKWAKVYMPNVDFSWLTCPLQADAEVGSHYGSKVKLNQWLEENSYANT